MTPELVLLLWLPTLAVAGVAADLERHLLENYSTIARPVSDQSQTIVVQMDFILNQLLTLNEQEQKITTAVWQVRKWRDTFLQWNPEDFGNITDVRIDKTRIWFPDLVVTNTIQYHEIDVKLKVDHTGDVMWDAAYVLETSCHVNVKYFPYDHQFCDIWIGSWTFHVEELDLRNNSDKGNIDYYVENDEWDLIDVAVRRTENFYPGYDSPLIDLVFTIHVKRRPRFFELNIILPCALLSVVVIAVFCLPCECGEKITLSITILLALAVNNVMISEQMPPSSKNSPILGDYFLAQVSLVLISVFASVIVLSIHHKGAQRRPIPHWARVFVFRYMASVLLMSNSITNKGVDRPFTPRTGIFSNINKITRKISKVKLSRSSPKFQNSSSHPLGICNMANGGIGIPPHNDSPDESEVNSGGPGSTGVSRIQTELESIHVTLAQVRQFLVHHEQDIGTETEWKEMAMVVDRLFSILFFIMSSSVSVAYMLAMPLGADHQLHQYLDRMHQLS